MAMDSELTAIPFYRPRCYRWVVCECQVLLTQLVPAELVIGGVERRGDRHAYLSVGISPLVHVACAVLCCAVLCCAVAWCGMVCCGVQARACARARACSMLYIHGDDDGGDGCMHIACLCIFTCLVYLLVVLHFTDQVSGRLAGNRS